MEKLKNIWVVAEHESATAELTTGATALGETVTLVCSGTSGQATAANAAYSVGDLANESWINYIPAIVSLVKDHNPQMVLVEASKNGRLTAAAIAVAMRTSVLTDPFELRAEDDAVIGKRMVYGGAAFKAERAVGGTAVACVGAGVFEADFSTTQADAVGICPSEAGIHLIERREKELHTVNLAVAKVVVGVGRGFGDEKNLRHARELAAAIGGEVGCSRPVAEEEKWMPKEAYMGVSGVMIKANVYVGCGISGQIQHMTGVNQSKAIFAVNKDKNAPIFAQCDYGIVGDVNKVLPALAQKFRE